MNPAGPGVSVTSTATVTPANGSNGTPTGTIQLEIDGADSGSPIELINGSASVATSALGAGSHSVTAIYTSDNGLFTNNNGSLAGGQSVGFATQTIPGIVAPKLAFGQMITFTVSAMSTSSQLPVPLGTVTFLDGASVIGTATLTDGVAQFDTASLGIGAHSIQAFYGASGDYLGSDSTAVSFTLERDASAISIIASAIGMSLVKTTRTFWPVRTRNVGPIAPLGGLSRVRRSPWSS